ncbi:MAG TPA: thioesterase domain-containing protein [Pedobacter sp.]
MKNINIICLPFAGGNKYSYRTYSEKAPAILKFSTLEYPGRGARMKESLIFNLEDLVDDLYGQCISQINSDNYAIYGHSMGGLLSYLLTKKIIKNGLKAPRHLFITGTLGPSAPSRLEKKRSLMGKEDFLQEIKDFGGMPEEILQNDELLDFFEPILRADFTVSESYRHTLTSPFDIPMTVITGSEEDMEIDEINLWQQETTEPIDFKVLSGGHFFIYEHVESLLYIMATKLS